MFIYYITLLLIYRDLCDIILNVDKPIQRQLS